MLPRPLLVLLLPVIFSLAALSQQSSGSFTQGSIDVTVRSLPGNQPVQDARVEVIDPRTGQSIGAGYTNAVGNVVIANLPSGDYDVVATTGLVETRQRTHLEAMENSLTLGVSNGADDSIGTSSTVSVAEYKIPEKARDRLRKAHKELSRNQLDKAVKHLEEALAIFPDFAEALTLRAIIRMDLKQEQNALDDLNAAVKIDPSYALAYFAQGAIYNVNKDYQKAIDALERGLSLAPQSWQGYFELAKSYMGQGDYKRSLTNLQKAQAYTTSEYPPIHLVRAHALLGLKEYSEAMVELESYLKNSSENDPDAADARRTLGQVKAFVSAHK